MDNHKEPRVTEQAEPVRYEYRVVGAGCPTPWRETSKERYEQMMADPQVEFEGEEVSYEVRALYVRQAAPEAPTLTLENAPMGTKAPAIGGGHWVRVEQGWKWCTGSTFPRPGGDWNGKLIAPAPATQQAGAAVEGTVTNYGTTSAATTASASTDDNYETKLEQQVGALQRENDDLRTLLNTERARYFTEHGVLHDRVTGQHLWTQDQYDEQWRTMYKAGQEDAANGFNMLGKRNEEQTRPNDQGHAQDAQNDTGATSAGRGAGADQHHEHRERQPGSHHEHAGCDSSGAGVSGAVPVQAAEVGAAPSMQPSADKCDECAGTGGIGPDSDPMEFDCDVCNGTGRAPAPSKEAAPLDVPAGYTAWMHRTSISPHNDDARHPFDAFQAGVEFAALAQQGAT